VEGLEPAAGDIHVTKQRMSGFFDTPLDSVLRNLRVDTVLFTGVNADQCVLATLTDAARLGYDAVLLEDGVATTSPEFCLRATLYNVERCFGFVARGADLLAAVRDSAAASADTLPPPEPRPDDGPRASRISRNTPSR
jgi:nicotinamidase-related amidase